MSDIFPSTMNIILLKKILINANTDVVKLDHDIVEYNIGKSNIQCWMYLPYIQQAPIL